MEILQDIDKADPMVLKLLRMSGAKVYYFEEAEKQGMLITDGDKRITGGIYDCKYDIIAINPSFNCVWDFHEINNTLLHELTHWTGSRNRLQRKAIMEGSSLIPHHSLADIETEEATAQWGCYFLAMALGLDEKLYFSKLKFYLQYFPQANLVKAKSDAKDAANYLLEMIEKRKVA